ncbi:MAG: ABC transporter permease [Treponema sp.]|nr:ABC transporter permease [Treponema sp.]
MKTKTIFLGLALILCFGGLCVPVFLARQEKNLLLALPKETGRPGIDMFDMEEFSKKEFLLTCEIPCPERVSLSYAEFPVTMTETSASYAQIMKFPITEGSFFSYQAWAGKLRHAVLNEKAAITIFGSGSIAGNRFSIRNETWIVTGVIKDGNNKKSIIYVPSSIRGTKADALAMMVSDTMDETYMKNSLKTLRIMESDFDFIDFNSQIRLIWERITVLLLCFAGFLFLSMLMPLITMLKKAWLELKNEFDHFYLREVFQNNKILIVKNVLPALGLALLSALTLILFVNITTICLPWQDIPSIGRFNQVFFYRYLEKIYFLELASRVLFILSIGIMGMFFFTFNLFINKTIKSRKTAWIKTAG